MPYKKRKRADTETEKGFGKKCHVCSVRGDAVLRDMLF